MMQDGGQVQILLSLLLINFAVFVRERVTICRDWSVFAVINRTTPLQN